MTEIYDLRASVQLELAAQILAAGGKVRLRALGNSMLPTLWPGDLVTIDGASCHDALPGDLVLVLVNQRPLIHRVRKRFERDGLVRWVTRGDAVPQSDPPVAQSDLLGTVSSIQRNRRAIIPTRRFSRTAQVMGWVLCHWDRFRSICLRLHSRLDGSPQQTQTEEVCG